MEGVRMVERSEGKEIDGTRKQKEIKQNAIGNNLRRGPTKENKMMVRNFMIESFPTYSFRGQRI